MSIFMNTGTLKCSFWSDEEKLNRKTKIIDVKFTKKYSFYKRDIYKTHGVSDLEKSKDNDYDINFDETTFCKKSIVDLIWSPDETKHGGRETCIARHLNIFKDKTDFK